MPSGSRARCASVADVDDSGNEIEGTGVYASSGAHNNPAKEQPNTGRARREGRRPSSPITVSAVTDSDSTAQPRGDSGKKSSKDREKSASGKKALMATSRATGKHTKASKRASESAYYGIDPSTMSPAISRPGPPSRPSSMYGPPMPPPSNSRFYASQPPGPPGPFPPPSFMGPGPPPPPHPLGHPPPPSPFGPPPPGPLVMQPPPPHPHPHPHPPPPLAPSGASDLFSRPLEHRPRPLEHRFGRPQSAMGIRQPPAIEYDDEYDEPERSLARRPSTTRRPSKHEDDRRAMQPPPPRRANSARPTALAFRPPPSAPTRRKQDFDDGETDLDDPFFHDPSPLGPGSYEHPRHFPPPRGYGAEFGYDVPDYQTEVAGGRRRRNTYYGGSSGSAYEDKMRLATQYQDEVAGAQVPLTAETLRRAGRSGPSSRSTRSSGSHDESEYRQSATTRTTRSTAANDEDVTIKVKGNTLLKFGNTEMQCENAEINITSKSGNGDLRATGSDRSSYIDREDDRRTRVDIPKSRVRGTSRAKSRPRSFSYASSRYELEPKYDVGLSRGYDYVPAYEDFEPEEDNFTTYDSLPHPPPSYPEYPSSYSSRPGDYLSRAPFGR